MLISIEIEKTQPLTGTASTLGQAPVTFVGWMGLLRVVSELTETMDASSGAARVTGALPTIQAIPPHHLLEGKASCPDR